MPRSSPPGPATVATAEELAAVWRGLRRSDILPMRPATLVSGLAARHLQFERLEGVQQHTDRLRRPARPGARTRRAGHRAVSFTHSVSVTPDISPESGDDLSPSRR